MPDPPPPLDDIDREEFFRGTAGDDSDDEYELEPIDPSVPSAYERHARRVLENASQSIDVDAAYVDERTARERAIGQLWDQLPRQFNIRHLMLATALVALLLTLRTIVGGFGSLFLAGTALVAAALYLIKRKEEQLARELADRRRRFHQQQRRLKLGDLADVGSMYDDSPEGPPAASGPIFSFPQVDFRLAFSLRQILILITVAAVLLGLLNFFGSPAAVALLLGVVAAGGLAAYLAGIEPPERVVMFWWILVGLYVMMSLVAMIWGG